MPNASTSPVRSILPEDIWSEIAEQLSAFDVFSLSQVSAKFAGMTIPPYKG
jgi:hypothetical protein